MDAERLKALFGERVRELRLERDLTQEELAEATSLSVEYVSKIERGLASPSFSVIARLIEVLEVSPHELFQLETGKDDQG
jgi:transcriptional regulator with XRE-family HTH domain